MFKFLIFLFASLSFTLNAHALVLDKRDSSEIISPAYGATVTQNSTITVRTMRWGMSFYGGGNYTVQNQDGIVIYGPVALDFGQNVVNMTAIGVGSYEIVLVQGQWVLNYTTSQRELKYYTTVHPFTVVDELPVTTTVPTTTAVPTVPTTTDATTMGIATTVPTTSPSSTPDSHSTSSTSSSGRKLISPSATGIYVSLFMGMILAMFL